MAEEARLKIQREKEALQKAKEKTLLSDLSMATQLIKEGKKEKKNATTAQGDNLQSSSTIQINLSK